MDDAATLLDRAHERKQARRSFDSQWAEMARLVRLLRDDFDRRPTPGERRGDDVYDSTPIYAAQNMEAGLYADLTNEANVWFLLRHPDESLTRFQRVRAWLDQASAITLQSASPANSPFYNNVSQLYGDETVFGMGVFYSEQVPGTHRIIDVCRPLSECFIDVNEYDEVDTLDRLFEMTAKQIRAKFPDQPLPERVQAAFDNGKDTKFPVLHTTYPNPDHQPGRLGWRGKPWLSIYVLEEGKSTLQVGGYWDFPYQVPRWSVAAGEIYGRGCTLNAMPDIRMLQAMNRTLIQRAEWEAKPPMLAPREGTISVMRTVPGRVTYGAVSPNGSPLVHPLQPGGNLSITLEIINSTREAIKDAFHFSLMQLVGRTGMTATEVATRNQEKMRLMGPNLGRNQSEFMSPWVKRRFAMLWRAGQIPPPPPELRGEPLQIHYQSPMAQAQKSAEGVATMRLLEAMAPLAQIDPGALDRLNVDATIEVLQDSFGAPARILLSDDELAAKRQARAQAQQLASGLAAGQQGADIVAKLAQAAAPAQGVPQ